jgi:hypothetical protein
MKTILLAALLLLLPTLLLAQGGGGLVPPGGGGTTPPPVCEQKVTTCQPPDAYGRPGQCTTITTPCPVDPPKQPACIDIYGRVVPCK